MAIFHCSVKVISRSSGRSATAAAAYRAGVCLKDERSGEVHDYTRKKGIEFTAIYLPDHICSEWAQDREQLWNRAEASEKRKNAQVAREIELALPAELSAEERRILSEDMSRYLANQYGVAVDAAIHRPSREGDQRNHHVHLLLNTRKLTQEGFGAKTRELDDRTQGRVEIERIRTEWAKLANRALERAGQVADLDHRSNHRRGLKRMATLHLGPSACAMERRGEMTRLGNRNRQTQALNVQVADMELEHLHLEQLHRESLEKGKTHTPAPAFKSLEHTKSFNELDTPRKKIKTLYYELNHAKQKYEQSKKDLDEYKKEVQSIGIFKRTLKSSEITKKIKELEEKLKKASIKYNSLKQEFNTIFRQEKENKSQQQQGIHEARQRFYMKKSARASAKAEAERKERQRKQQEAEEERERKNREWKRKVERANLEKQYGLAVCMLICPQSLSAARTHPEYGQYLDRLQNATPDQRTDMVRELSHAERRYKAQELFYSWAKLVSRETSISGREKVRDAMLKEWDKATPDRQEQMELEAKEYVRTHEQERQSSDISMSMGR